MILITRPYEDSKAFAKALKKRKHNSFIEPMLSVAYADIRLEDQFDEAPQSFITTSKHAKIFAPEEMPLASIPENGKNSEELFSWIINNLNANDGKIVYLRGNEIKFNMTKALKDKTYDAEEIIVYETTYPDFLSERLERNFAKIKLITFFSAETFKTFMKLAKKHNLKEQLEKMKVLALSPRIAELANDYKWDAVFVSDEPNANSMLKKIDEISL